MRMIQIYMIYNTITRKRYIGRSRDPESRIKSHMYCLRSNIHNCEDMQKDFNKYGEESFTFKILQKGNTRDDQAYTNSEYFWMDVFDSINRSKGYNYNDLNARQIIEKVRGDE